MRTLILKPPTPWLLSPEARAPTRAQPTEDDPDAIDTSSSSPPEAQLSQHEQNYREEISRTLKRELENKHRVVEDWGKRRPPSRCGKGDGGRRDRDRDRDKDKPHRYLNSS